MTVADTAFEELTTGLRPELIAHCYRMLGCISDAEDQVQETYLRAWRAFDRFEGRASVRTWMYRIATNACLDALRAAPRRPLPSGLGQPAGDPTEPLVARPDLTWLEPLPDAVLWGSAPPDPAEAAVAREGVGVAGVAAWQALPPNQRAALLLRDVLAFSAAETAEALGCSVAAANSALQRARATVATLAPNDGVRVEELIERDRAAYEAFLTAFEAYDVPRVVELLAEDATWEMPPFDRHYRGRRDIGVLIGAQCPADGPGALAMRPCVLGGRPAAAMYLRGADGRYLPLQLQALAMRDGVIGHVVGFMDTALFAAAGMPEELPARQPEELPT